MNIAKDKKEAEDLDNMMKYHNKKDLLKKDANGFD